MPVTGTLLGLGAAGQIFNGVSAYNRQSDLENQARQLAQVPVPQYTASTPLTRLYQSASSMFATPQGYSPAQTTAFNQNLSRLGNTSFTNATQIGGGNLARAIGGMNNINQTDALNKFAQNNAQLTQSNQNLAFGRLSQATGQLQGLQDKNTATALQRRLILEHALGTGIQSNRDLWTQGLENESADLTGAGAYGLMKGRVPTSGTNPNITQSIYSNPSLTGRFRGDTQDYIGGDGSTYFNGNLGSYYGNQSGYGGLAPARLSRFNYSN